MERGRFLKTCSCDWLLCPRLHHSGWGLELLHWCLVLLPGCVLKGRGLTVRAFWGQGGSQQQAGDRSSGTLISGRQDMVGWEGHRPPPSGCCDGMPEMEREPERPGRDPGVAPRASVCEQGVMQHPGYRACSLGRFLLKHIFGRGPSRGPCNWRFLEGVANARMVGTRFQAIWSRVTVLHWLCPSVSGTVLYPGDSSSEGVR